MQSVFGRRKKKKTDGPIKWITYMGIKLDSNIRVISSWGICFKELSSSVSISSYIKLQEAAHEFEHIG